MQHVLRCRKIWGHYKDDFISNGQIFLNDWHIELWMIAIGRTWTILTIGITLSLLVVTFTVQCMAFVEIYAYASYFGSASNIVLKWSLILQWLVRGNNKHFILIIMIYFRRENCFFMEYQYGSSSRKYKMKFSKSRTLSH